MKFLALTLLVCLLILPLKASEVFGTTSEELVKKLELENWEDLFYKRGELKRYKEGDRFRTLVEVVENKGLDWHIRIKGIRLLSNTHNVAAPDILIGMLYDPFFNHECPAIKSSVAEALGNFKRDHRVVDALLHSMNDEEIHVREASVDSLGKIGNKKAVPALLKVLNDKSVAMRIAAIRALGRIGDPSAVASIQRIAVKDVSEEVRSVAADVIHRLGK